MIYIYLKELIKRLNFIIFGILFTITLSIIYKEELMYNIILYYFKIFKFQVLLLTGIFDKVYIELLLIYVISFITSSLLFIINFILFCIPIITKKKIISIINNIYYFFFIFIFYLIINIFFIIIINLIKNKNTYIFLQKNVINEIRFIEYKNFIFILLFSNIIIFFIGIIIFYSIIKIKNIKYKYFINIRLINFLFLSFFIIFIIPPDYILHFIILFYYLFYIEGLFIFTIFIKVYNKYKKNICY